MSDSELSDDPGTPLPSDNELEQSLRREVVKGLKTSDNVTVKRIRAASEKRLGLPEDFYKSHASWKDKSKGIIEDQVNNEGDVPSSPILKKSRPANPTKRKSEEPEEVPKKKRKVSKEESSGELSSPPGDAEEESEPEVKPKEASKKTKVPAKPKKGPAEKKSAKESKEAEPSETEEGDDSKVADGNNSDSDLSVLIDKEPAKKKRGKSKSKDSQDKPKKPKSKNTTKTKTKEDEDPDRAEIKRLQGWLVKCGIRKVWGKELKPYETPKAKIKHLKDMLSDAGMTGRYSVEKASQIKEQREMAADIEAVKEGAERWGTSDQDEQSGSARPQRKLVRGSKHFDFLSSDGEETD